MKKIPEQKWRRKKELETVCPSGFMSAAKVDLELVTQNFSQQRTHLIEYM